MKRKFPIELHTNPEATGTAKKPASIRLSVRNILISKEPMNANTFMNSLSILFEREETPNGMVLHAELEITPKSDCMKEFETTFSDLDAFETAASMLHSKACQTLALITPGTKPTIRIESEYWNTPTRRIDPISKQQVPGPNSLLQPGWWNQFNPGIIPFLEPHTFSRTSPDGVTLLSVICLRGLSKHLTKEQIKKLESWPEHLSTLLAYNIVTEPKTGKQTLEYNRSIAINIPLTQWDLETSEAINYLNSTQANREVMTPKNEKAARKLFNELKNPLSNRGKYLAKQWTRLLYLGHQHPKIVQDTTIPAEFVQAVCKNGWKDHESMDPLTVIRSGTPITPEIRKVMAKHVGSRTLSIYRGTNNHTGMDSEIQAWNQLAEKIQQQGMDEDAIQDCSNIAYRLYARDAFRIPVPRIWKNLKPFTRQIILTGITHLKLKRSRQMNRGSNGGESLVEDTPDHEIIQPVMTELEEALAILKGGKTPTWLEELEAKQTTEPKQSGLLQDLEMLKDHLAKKLAEAL